MRHKSLAELQFLHEVAQAQGLAERVPHLEHEIRELTADRNKWQQLATTLGARTEVTELPGLRQLALSVRLSEELIATVQSPETLVQSTLARMYKDVMRVIRER